MTVTHLSAKQLRRAAALREKIDSLEKALAATLNLAPETPAGIRQGRGRPKKVPPVRGAKAKRRFSKAARAKMAAAAKKRWAKAKAAGKKSL